MTPEAIGSTSLADFEALRAIGVHRIDLNVHSFRVVESPVLKDKLSVDTLTHTSFMVYAKDGHAYNIRVGAACEPTGFYFETATRAEVWNNFTSAAAELTRTAGWLAARLLTFQFKGELKKHRAANNGAIPQAWDFGTNIATIQKLPEQGFDHTDLHGRAYPYHQTFQADIHGYLRYEPARDGGVATLIPNKTWGNVYDYDGKPVKQDMTKLIPLAQSAEAKEMLDRLIAAAQSINAAKQPYAMFPHDDTSVANSNELIRMMTDVEPDDARRGILTGIAAKLVGTGKRTADRKAAAQPRRAIPISWLTGYSRARRLQV